MKHVVGQNKCTLYAKSIIYSTYSHIESKERKKKTKLGEEKMSILYVQEVLTPTVTRSRSTGSTVSRLSDPNTIEEACGSGSNSLEQCRSGIAYEKSDPGFSHCAIICS